MPSVSGSAYGAFSFHVDGGIPLLPDLAPNISANLVLELKCDTAGTLMAKLTGSHDGFPAYEFYINGQRIHHYDPVAAGKTPDALFGEGDRSVNIEWRQVSESMSDAMALGRRRVPIPRRAAGMSMSVWR